MYIACIYTCSRKFLQGVQFSRTHCRHSFCIMQVRFSQILVHVIVPMCVCIYKHAYFSGLILAVSRSTMENREKIGPLEKFPAILCAPTSMGKSICVYA